MNDYKVIWFSNTTAEDQNNYFCGEFGSTEMVQIGDFITLDKGTYRVVDDKLYQITPELPEDLNDNGCICPT